MHAFLHHSYRLSLNLIRFTHSSPSPMTSSMVLPSISVKKRALGAPESCISYSRLGFKNVIRRISRLNFEKSRVFMSVAVGSQTAVDDALFRDYKPSTAFLFPGQVYFRLRFLTIYIFCGSSLPVALHIIAFCLVNFYFENCENFMLLIELYLLTFFLYN